MSWFSQAWRSAGPTIAAVAAVASGNPELAIPASQAAAATIKPKKPAAPPVPIAPPAPAVLPGFWANLAPADQHVILYGGTAIGTLLAARLLFGGQGRR